MRQLQQGRGSGGVRSAEPRRGCFDVAEDTARADSGQLLIITDQPNTAAAANNELDGGVEGKRVRHPGLIDQHQRRGPMLSIQSGGSLSWYWSDQVSLASVSLGAPVWS